MTYMGMSLSSPDVVDEMASANFKHPIDEAFEFGRGRMARCPLMITRSEQCKTPTIRLANLVKNRDTVFMAFTPDWLT